MNKRQRRKRAKKLDAAIVQWFRALERVMTESMCSLERLFPIVKVSR